MKKKTSQNLFLIEVIANSRLPFSRAALKRFVIRLTKSLQFRQAHLNIFFVKDAAMRRWHLKLMGKNSTTDVLSLSQWTPKGRSREPNPLNSLGDVIVCLDEAKRQAKKNKCSYKEEVFRYITHGLLHCVGYDDVKPKDPKKMWTLQEKLLKKCI